jgi:rSAM/selenodomain-associated transferase 2
MLSVVMPVRNEEACLAATLASLRSGLRAGDEVLVADGRSTDGTAGIARAAGAIVVESERGRGRQMNAAVVQAKGEVLLFLHADTLLPAGFREAVEVVLRDPGVAWGRFDVVFDEGGPLLRLIAWLISTRSRLFRSATGDQAIFVRREHFDAVGGYHEALLFEDVDLVRRLRPRGRMGIPPVPAVTSSRRWRNRGVWSTTFRMWTLKSLYLLGVPAERLARHYLDER